MVSLNRALVLAVTIFSIVHAAKLSRYYDAEALLPILDNTNSYQSQMSIMHNAFTSIGDDPLSSVDSDQEDYPEGIQENIFPTPSPITEDYTTISKDDEDDEEVDNDVSWTPEPTMFPTYSPDRSNRFTNIHTIMPRFNGFRF